LSSVGCIPFCHIVSQRRKYVDLQRGITVDLDKVVYPPQFSYCIGEVEVMAEDESRVAEAEEKINAFMRDMRINSEKAALGKVIAFLLAERPDHFECLQKALGKKYPKLLRFKRDQSS